MKFVCVVYYYTIIFILCIIQYHHVKADEATFTICTCEKDSQAVHFASQKMKLHLEQNLCHGIHFERQNISSNASSIPKACLAIGPCASKIVGFKFPATKSIHEGEESFAYGKPTISDLNNYAITGSPTARSQRGTIYGTVSFLELFGIRFLTSNFTLNGTICPDTWKPVLNETTTLPIWPFELDILPASYSYNPPLEYRQIFQYSFSEDTDFGVLLGTNSPNYGNEIIGGGVIYASPPGFVHTSQNLAKRAELYDSNPSWFWPQDGNKTSDAGGQLCWSNASLVQYIIEEVKHMLKTQPDASIVSVSQNDNGAYCNSSAERKIYDEEGGVGIGPILRAVNAIADAIKDEHPNVKVDTLAYTWTRHAPLKTKPRDNVIIRLCSIECDFGSKLTDPSNAAFQKDIVDWSKISDTTYIWNYVTNFANYVMPWPDWYNISPNTEFYLKHSGKGIFQESSYQSYGGDMAPLKGYLMAKKMFYPEADGQAIIEDFLLGYYGVAASAMQEYLNLWSYQVKYTNTYLDENMPYDAIYLTPEVILMSGNIFKKAERLLITIGDNIRFSHVQEAKLPTLFVGMLQWERCLQYSKKNPNMNWPFEKTLVDTFNVFAEIYKTNSITHLSENGNNITWLKKELGIKM